MRVLFILITVTFCLFSCTNETLPKPTGYYRIDLPEKKYQLIDSIPFPFTFELPQYAIVNLKRTAENKSFLNVDFPKYGARIHMSYLPVDTNLFRLLEDSRTLVYKHVGKAQDINERLIQNKKKQVFGMFYGIDGNAASGSQFYITDSSNHFLRGALYFNVSPNFDSIAPVQNFIKEDIQQFIETFSWK